MARTVKVEFVGNARKLDEAALEAVAALGTVDAASIVSSDGMWVASQTTTGLGTALSSLASSVGPAVMPVLIGLAAIIAFALAPAIAFLVGELAALTAGFLPLFALGGLAFVFATLEQRTGALAGMTKTLTTDLNAAGNEIAQRAAPAMQSLFDWLDKLVPKGQTFADRAVDWFTKELPGALKELQGIFDRVGPIIDSIIGEIGKFFDDQLGHPKTFQEAVETAFKQIKSAIDTLLKWLGELSKWWDTDGKRFAHDADTDFKVLQTTVEVLASIFGVFAGEAERAGRAIAYIQSLGGGSPQVAAGRTAQFQGGSSGTPVLAGGGGGGNLGADRFGGVTIHINGAGLNAEQVAAAVDRRLARLLTST